MHQYGQGVIDLIDFNGKSTAIDLGCGNGVLTKALKEKGLSVIGIACRYSFLECCIPLD